jgi:hypothetical protein
MKKYFLSNLNKESMPFDIVTDKDRSQVAQYICVCCVVPCMDNKAGTKILPIVTIRRVE